MFFESLLLLEHALLFLQLGLLALYLFQLTLSLFDLSHLLCRELLLKFLLFFRLKALLFCHEAFLLGQLSLILSLDALQLLEPCLLGERQLLLVPRICILDDLLLFLLLLFARWSSLLVVVIVHIVHLHLELKIWLRLLLVGLGVSTRIIILGIMLARLHVDSIGMHRLVLDLL